MTATPRTIEHAIPPDPPTDGAADDRPWPAPLADEAYHGIAGEIVRAVEPHTEADPAAILVQLLAAAGNCVGRGPHYLVEGDQHGPQLYAVLVGETGRARKGTSWGRIRQMMDMLDERGARDRIVSGLSSSEGLLHAVRDGTDDDPGADDRRLLAMEPEFARVLRVALRDGNTLSATIREAWDRGTMSTLTRHAPITASDTHISMIGHVTADELRRYLDQTEAANGFANRYIYVCVRRARYLPDGGGEVDMRDIAPRLARAVGAARSAGRLRMDDAARAIWHRVYPALTAETPGMLGAVTARAEAQTVRLALTYALLDGAEAIRPPHLQAALAVWTYADASARHIWGAELGDPVADDIQRALRQAGSAGMTRTEIRDLFRRHRSADQLTRALDLLARLGRAQRHEVRTGGRPSEVWTAT